MTAEQDLKKNEMAVEIPPLLPVPQVTSPDKQPDLKEQDEPSKIFLQLLHFLAVSNSNLKTLKAKFPSQ